MTRTLTVFSALILLIWDAYAQTTIGQSEMPDKTTKTLYSYAETATSINHAQKGSDQTWDYSSLTYALQLEQEYKSAGSINIFFFGIRDGFGTKVADSLGVGQFQMKDIYDVFKTTSKKMTAEGRSLKYNGIPVPQFYEDKDELYQYPMTFGRSDTSTFKVRFSLANQLSMIQTGTRINVVEGEGQLITPYKTYPKCLKLKSTVQEIDSIKIGPLPQVGIPRNTVKYEWFVPGVVGPVLIVLGTEILGRFTVQEIRFQDEPVPLVGFEADNYVPVVNELVTLSDTSSIAAFTRTWNISPSTFSYENNTNANSENPELRFSAPGGYLVELSVRNRFGVMTESRTNYIQVLDNSTGWEVLNLNEPFSVYPNPCKSYLEYNSTEKISHLRVLNLLGEAFKVDFSDKRINTSELPPGVYLLQLQLESEHLEVIRFVKE
jgi:hypothetical protein